MKKKILIFLAVFTLGLGVLGVFHPEFALAETAKDAVCQGVGTVGNTAGCAEVKDAPTVNSVLNTVVNLLSLFVGIIAVIMIIVSGFRYVTSGGDPGKVSGAKSALIYALVGLAIAALAQVLVKYVLGKVI